MKRGGCMQVPGEIYVLGEGADGQLGKGEDVQDALRPAPSPISGKQVRTLPMCVYIHTHICVLSLSLSLHACPVLQGPGAFCDTVLIADFHPSRSLHLLHQTE